MSENGELEFSPNAERATDHFDMEFDIPYMAGKHTCMIRVNLGLTSHLFVHLVEEESDTIIDTSSFLPGKMHAADFFVPLSETGARVKIRFQPKTSSG